VITAGAPWSILGPAMAAGGGVLIALYILKLRRRRIEVPFVDLWRKVLRDTESTALWRKLRRILSLLLQLVLLALIGLAIADPRLATSQRGRTIALMVDVSASMQATDGEGGTRLQQAKEEARKLVRTLGAEDVVIVIALSGRPAPASGPSSDERELLAAIDSLAATDGPADPARALRLAADALRGRPNPMLVLIGDGCDALPAPAEELRSAAFHFIPVGKSSDNVGLTAFAVRRYRANQTAYEVLVELHSFRDAASEVKLELLQDGEVVETETVTMAAGERLQRVFSNLAGEGTRLTARLSRASGTGALDALPLDDVAYALLPPRKKLKVLLVAKAQNLFLEGALLLDENLDVQKMAPSAWDPVRANGFDAVVLDGFVPPTPPETHTLYVDPHGDGGPFPVAGELSSPIVTESATNHPLLRWVTFKDLNVSRASRFQLAPGDVAVASSFRQAIIAARDSGGRKVVAIGFDVRKSDLPLRVAFPVMLVNALDWFAGADTGVVASYALGQPWRLPAPAGAKEIAVRSPDGKQGAAPVHDGRATYFGEQAGYYQLVSPGVAPRLVAANLANAAESRIKPASELSAFGQPLTRPPEGRAGVRRVLWPYLLALVLALAFAEWFTYNRRTTV
jgi:hypothetical protein